MLKLTLMSKHNQGCCALELFRNEHNELSITVWDMAGGPQFDFDIDESDFEILTMMIERAKAKRQGGDGDE